MWKIRIEYDDESRMTLTGKQSDIPLQLALVCHNKYVSGKACKAIYQQYPKKDHESMDLMKKIEKLKNQQY